MYRLIIILYAGVAAATCGKELEAREYLEYLNKVVCERKYIRALANFEYSTNQTDENFKKLEEANSIPNIYASEYKYFDWVSFNNSYLLREATYYGLLSSNVSDIYSKNLDEIFDKMSSLRISDNGMCSYKNRSKCDDDSYTDMYTAFSHSVILDEVNYYYLQLLNNLGGGPIRGLYEQYINVSNEYARAHGYANDADYILDDFEDPPLLEFECALEDLWNQIKPFYFQFFSYLRSRFRQIFGDAISKTGPLPASLLYGCLSRVELLPFPKKDVFDITELFNKKNITGIKLARQAEDFYTSLGLEPLPQIFWDKSVFTKRNGTMMDCTPTTYDMYDNNDYRISMCHIHPQSIVHELGHAHNGMGYKDQPCCFRSPPNDGLSEGTADSMTIAFSSKKFLSRIGVLNNSQEIDDEVELNTLFTKAVNMLSMMPFALDLDLWRFNLFRGNVRLDECNKVQWEYRRKYEGVFPPENRSEDYLDAAIFHNIVYGDDLIGYFMLPLLDFQIFEATCLAAKEFDPNDPTKNPLHNCDIYGNKEAGKVMTKLYKPGSSQSWAATLKDAVGKPFPDATAFKRFFQKLYDFFAEENKKNGEHIGWI